MHVLILIAVAILALCLIFALLYWAFRSAKYIGLVLLGIAAGIPALLGRMTHAVAVWLRFSWGADPILALAASGAALGMLGAGKPMAALAFGVTGALAVIVAVARVYSAAATRTLPWRAWMEEQRIRHDLSAHVALWLAAATVAWCAYVGDPSAGNPYVIGVAITYWLGTSALQLFNAFRHVQGAALARRLEHEVPQRHGTPVSSLMANMASAYPTLGGGAALMIKQHVAFATLQGRLLEIELNGSRRLFCPYWYKERTQATVAALLGGVRYSEAAMVPLLRQFLQLEHKDGIDLLTHHVVAGQTYQFEDGHFFVSYLSVDHVECCASCGMARWLQAPRSVDGREPVWFCSSQCEQTERTCLDIHEQAPESFINDAITHSFTLVNGSNAWVQHHKMFAAGGQGHGFAAEQGNTLLDRLSGKWARVVGDDNVKNGPDRWVQGRHLQTKYCRTAARSVGSAFNNKGDGMYRYRNDDGTPMALEVPADQHAEAVRVMEQKIAQGKVEGVTDPAKAEELVVRGRLKYEQARNMVGFGRIEGLAFDLAEGAVVGLGAASISFCVSSALIYLRNGDATAALQAAAWQAGKVGLLSTGSYVAIQQIHRIAPVQSLLDCINVGGFPPTLREVLKNGMGVKADNALNRALGGAAVSSVVSIGMATAPDLYRMIRREITLAKLKRTVVTATGGAVGAFVGSVVGGAVAAPAGPLGIFIGRTAGGIVGGLAATATIDWLFAEQREREEAMANHRFQAHLAYLTLTFAMTEQEVQIVVRNFLSVGGKSTQQKILAGKFEGRVYLNSLLKPMVVGVVKQRAYLPSPEESLGIPLEATTSEVTGRADRQQVQTAIS